MRGKLALLKHAFARRKGYSKRQWYSFETGAGITIQSKSGPDADSLAISFMVPGGHKPADTFVEIAIKPADFATVLDLMASTDRDAALRAMAEEMRNQLCGRSK